MDALMDYDAFQTFGSKGNYIEGTVVANKTGPTRVADFRAVFTAERPYLFLGSETTYAIEQ